MTERVFGSADDFYRIRILRVDVPDELEWEWRDDILWRRPEEQAQGETARYRVDAVLKDSAVARTLAETDGADAAREIALTADEDLAQLTKRQFDARYGLETDSGPARE
jgi:hypothetical protein